MPEEIFELVVRVCSWIIVTVCFPGGLGLLIFPKGMAKLNKTLNRSFFTKVLVEPIERPIDTDQLIIANRIVLGIIALVVSIVLFIQLMVK